MVYNIPNSNGYDLRHNISDALNDIDNKTFSTTIVSTVVDGTSPLQVASTTKVDNLNADMVGGYRLWEGDQAAYDAIAVKDPNTIYLIGD